MIAAPKVTLRDVQSADLPALLELNESEVPHVNSVPLSLFDWFASDGVYFRVACREDREAPVAFLTGLLPAMPHDSLNFLWFKARYDRFLYIDRIVVAGHSRRLGIGALLYDDLERFARPLAPMLCCDVNLRPHNPESLAFHERRGFRQVGTQETEGGFKLVSLMARFFDDASGHAQGRAAR